MNAISRNPLAVIVGGLVNGGLASLGPSLVPLPEGADVSTMEGLRASMSLFTPANFLFPFLGSAEKGDGHGTGEGSRNEFAPASWDLRSHA